MRIMFVCHGNICRSPMAELVLKKMIKEKGLEGRFLVSSSATSTEEIFNGVGNPVYPPAREELAKHGISTDGKRAVQLKREDADNYDMFIGMDSANIRNMYKILGEGCKGKITKLLDYTDRGGDVADPWYTGNFSLTYKDVTEGCEALLKKLLSENAE
jgi:protein-tyrosine phosphatase